MSHAPLFDGVLIVRAVTDVHKNTDNPLLEALKDPKIQRCTRHAQIQPCGRASAISVHKEKLTILSLIAPYPPGITHR